ncbi:hypothetical protein AB0J90_35035 [Micromonospora sp. NPDC049523]|uniref:hypothetical protein n=1 Tax=Micromonospora sp. NPDC049523 TaxID=3155921 RepID=UPI00342B4532
MVIASRQPSDETSSGDPWRVPVYTPAETLSRTTRHLCAAAYLDPTFREQVIQELLHDERRAVAQSQGFDLVPIVRHCLRARRIMFTQDLLVTGLLLIGLLLTPVATICWSLFGGLLLVGRLPRAGRREPREGFLLHSSLVVPILLAAAAVGLFGATVFVTDPDELEMVSLGYGIPETVLARVGDYLLLSLLLGVGLAIVTFLVLLRFRREAYEILVDELAPDLEVSPYPVANDRIERRLGRIAAAQHGNITVQERNPFLGAGQVMHGWSFAVTLRRARTGGRREVPEPVDGERTGTPGAVRVDPVDLVEHVRAAVRGMSDGALPERERLTELRLVPHVVADGVRVQDDLLLEPESQMPYTLASKEALKTVIRTPQGGLRYYERIVVPMGGRQIRADDGEVLLDAQDLDCVVSVFVHLAVEGGRLYAELRATLLPPVRLGYQLADVLPEDRLMSRPARDARDDFATDVLGAPWRMVRGAVYHREIVRRMDEASRNSHEFRLYDYGARLSVRELGAEPDTYKFLQALDGWKYVKLVDRTVSDAIIDFLTEHGIDATEFRAGVTHVHNQFGSVDISGGQVNLGGTNAGFAQHNSGKATDG